jgi:hypothetical protein
MDVINTMLHHSLFAIEITTAVIYISSGNLGFNGIQNVI